MILSVFITVISGHDKPQPPGCLLELFQFLNKTFIGIVPENDAMFGKFSFKASNKVLILQVHNPMLLR
ncbi:hypothetical protein ECDEC8E_5318 [Escherichia coli DEC8E]|nr:hypothetical protein ECDEC8E_5318 [Escherichia coli DEC8E]